MYVNQIITRISILLETVISDEGVGQESFLGLRVRGDLLEEVVTLEISALCTG